MVCIVTQGCVLDVNDGDRTTVTVAFDDGSAARVGLRGVRFKMARAASMLCWLHAQAAGANRRAWGSHAAFAAT